MATKRRTKRGGGVLSHRPSAPARRRGHQRGEAHTKLSTAKAQKKSVGGPIVGVGGFEAAMELLRHLPPKTGMAFVIVQHLDPHHASRLPKLLSKVTTMPVIELADAAKPRPNREYSLRVRPCYTTDHKKERYAGKTSNRPKQVF